MVLLVVAILKNCRTNYSSYTFFSSLNAPKVRFSATLGQGPDIELGAGLAVTCWCLAHGTVQKTAFSETSLGGQDQATPASALGARIIADMPGTDLSRSLRATLHEHSHLLPERVLADRGLDVANRLHRLAVYL
jgi:hypothetical protein